jgi:hypothetical protein
VSVERAVLNEGLDEREEGCGEPSRGVPWWGDCVGRGELVRGEVTVNWDCEAVRDVGDKSCEPIWGVWEGVWKTEGFGDNGSLSRGELCGVN